MSGGDSIIVKTGLFCNDGCCACIVCECSWSLFAGSFLNWSDYLPWYINGDESEVAVGSTSQGAWDILSVSFSFRTDFLQVRVGGITHDTSECRIVEVYFLG